MTEWSSIVAMHCFLAVLKQCNTKPAVKYLFRNFFSATVWSLYKQLLLLGHRQKDRADFKAIALLDQKHLSLGVNAPKACYLYNLDF